MHSHSTHSHAPGPAAGLGGVLALTLAFAGVEALGGLWSGSLALLGDAGHMLTDAVALGLAALAARFGRRPPSPRHSYGLARAEIVAALINGLLMLAVVSWLSVQAVERLLAPRPVVGEAVIGIALAGLAVNGVVALRLSRAGDNLNVRAALLHVVGDALGAVAALIAGVVVYATGWWPIDPLLALVIGALILYSTFRLLREALHILLEGVPHGLDLNRVGRSMAQLPGVGSVHDLHIWTLASGVYALSAHVVVQDLAAWPEVLGRMQELLARRYRIRHVTLQPELPVAAPLAYRPRR